MIEWIIKYSPFVTFAIGCFTYGTLSRTLMVATIVLFGIKYIKYGKF